MPAGARRIVVAAFTAAVAVGITTTGLTPAAAAPARCSDPAEVASAKLTSCISDLRLEAEAAGVRAARADEAYLQARLTVDWARDRLETVSRAAAKAALEARRSRTRAAVVVAHLTRSGGSVGQTAGVLLSGDRAGEMLHDLSRVSDLSADTSSLATTANRDQDAATRARADAVDAEQGLTAVEEATRVAFERAKRESEKARLLVQQAEAKRVGETGRGRVRYVDLPADAPTAAKVLAFARAQVGEPYVFGAAGPTSWDCSGLTMGAFGTAGVEIGGHSSNAQYHLAESRGLLVPYDAAQPGDLIFWGAGDLYHVAIYSGGGNMIEAPMPGRTVREVPVRTDDLAPMAARFTG